MRVDAAFRHQQRAFGRQRGEAFGGAKISDEALEIAVVDPDQPRAQRRCALHFGCVVDFDEHVHAALIRGLFDLLHRPVFQRGDDDQDCISPDRARLGDLPGIDHEILAQHRQCAGGAGGDQKVLVALKVGSIGQDREAGGSASRIGAGMVSGVKILADESLGRRCFLDFCDQRKAICCPGFQCGAKPARRRLHASARVEFGKAGFALACRNFAALGLADFGELVRHGTALATSQAGWNHLNSGGRYRLRSAFRESRRPGRVKFLHASRRNGKPTGQVRPLAPRQAPAPRFRDAAPDSRAPP